MNPNAITTTDEDQDRELIVAATADQFARERIFEDYHTDKLSENTLRRQQADLATFVEYLVSVQFYANANGRAERLYHMPAAWSGITYGVVTGFVRWLLQNGYAVGTVNLKLSTVKQYAKLAFQAGALNAEQHALIRTVTGFQFKDRKRIDEKRAKEGAATRKGVKKAESVTLTNAQVKALKTQPDTPQGRRDALIMAILLDLGLRVGELALLEVTTVNLSENSLTFYRPKVGKTQTLDLNTKDLKRAFHAWFDSGDAPAAGKLLSGRDQRVKGQKVQNGGLGHVGMSEHSITARVRSLGEQIGVKGLSAHDLRHSWATRFARKYRKDTLGLQESGGWNSLAMPRRYVENAEIANEGYSLDEDES